MPYIGNPIYQSAFVTDQFSGNGSTTAFTMSVAPAGVSNVLVAVSGVLQDPSTYGVVGNTITFSTAPPSGTGNISCRYLGVPVTGIVTTAYRTVTEFTATASQTTFTPPSYTVGFINVYLNGVLLGSADYTATNGTTVVLATGASAGNLVTVESFRVETVLNAISNSAGSVGTTNIADNAITTAKIASGVTVNFADGSASTPSITNDGDTNTGMFFPAADTIAFAEGGAESMRIDSSGNVGIGSTLPGAKFAVFGSFAKSSDENTWGVKISDETAMAAGVGGGITFVGNYTTGGAKAPFGGIAGAKVNSTTSNGLGELRLYATNVSSILTEAMRLNSSGTVILQGGSTSATGVGITFPATQSASSDANTLDDYEEGTFTPIVYGLSSAGTTTYSDQVGFYTKVGNLVTAFYQVTVSAMTGTGAVALGGLPFTTNSSGASAAPVMIEALNWTGGSYIQLYIGSSRTYAIPYYMTDDSGWGAQQCVNETQAYIATITYRV